MSYLYHTYGEIVSLARDTTDYVFVFAPKYNHQVLSNTALFYNLDPSSSPLAIPENSSLSRLFAGLTQMNGVRHKQHRHLMMPALQRQRIEAYYSEMVIVTEKKLAGWAVGQQRDIYKEMRDITLSVAVKTLVGLDPEQGGDEVCRLLDLWTGLVFSLSALVLPLNLPGFSYRRLLRASEELERVIRSLIERKRACGLDTGDVLSMLMQVHDEDDNRLTDDELVGQTNFLFMAGHATTASALTWTLFLLAQHPRVLSEVLDECEDKIKIDSPDIKDLEEMTLMEAVIKETMRLMPPVLWWARVSTADCSLGPYTLPAGARIINSAFITHRIADHYPQPNRFLPERWLHTDPGPYEYIPFSAGPRMCLGSGFAMIEMKLVLATILRRYRLTLPEGIRVNFGGRMLSAPRGGMPVVLDSPHRKLTRAEVGGNIRSFVELD
jgi:cytochrome P450